LKFIICGPDLEMCICTDNGSLPQFVGDKIWTLQTQLVEKIYYIKYYV